MPRRCAVIGCSPNGLVLNKSYYRFPNNQELCKKWLKALCNLELVKIYETKGINFLNKNKFVCSDHFETKHLRNVKAPSQGLFEGAVPTVGLNSDVDALITSLKKSELLDEIGPPLPVCKKHQNTSKKCSKDMTKESNKQPQEINSNKKNKSSTEEINKSKTLIDNIPLKQLYGEKIKTIKTENEPQTTKCISKRTIKINTKKKKFKVKQEFPSERHKDKNSKSNSKQLNKIEEIYLPTNQMSSSETFKVTHRKKVKIKPKNSLADLKKKLMLSKINDPLANIKKEPVDFIVQHSSRKIKIRKKDVSKRKKGIKKKKVLAKSKNRFIKVIVAPKNINNDEITRGPKRIIKVNRGQNKSIKIVVPKRVINGKEINLDKTEISKILKLVTSPEKVNGKDLKLITQSSEVDRILKLVSVNKNIESKNQEVDRIIETETTRVRKYISVKNVESDVKIVTKCVENSIKLKPVPPPKNINGKEIKLVVLDSANGKMLKPVRYISSNDVKVTKVIDVTNVSKENFVPSIVNDKEVLEKQNNCDINSMVCDGLDHEHSNSSDVPLISHKMNDVGSEKDLTSPLKVYQEAEKNNTETALIPSSNLIVEEVNPLTRELCKRIKHMIGQRFGDMHDSSDSESNDADPKNQSKKNGKKAKKKCTCNTVYHEKMLSLWQEEQELKRRLLATQNLANKHKINNRKLATTVVELRQQIPEKKPPKPEHIIKTVVPLNKVKEKNPRKYRFTKVLKSFALDLFYSSPLSYSILEKIYFLPSRKTLKNWLVHPKNIPNNFMISTSSEMNNQMFHENSESVEEYIDVGENTAEYVGGQTSQSEILNHSHSMLVQQQQNMGHHQVLPLPPPHSHTHPHHPHHTHNSHSHSNHPHHTHSHSHSIETTHHTMGTIEDNIEPLQENIDDIMFRNDLAEAIMNS